MKIHYIFCFFLGIGILNPVLYSQEKDSTNTNQVGIDHLESLQIIGGPNQSKQNNNLVIDTLYYTHKGDSVINYRYYIDGIEVKDEDYYIHSGRVKSIFNFVDGKKHGTQVLFNKNGTPSMYMVYDMGESISTIFFHENGMIESLGVSDNYRENNRGWKYYKTGELQCKDEQLSADTIIEKCYYKNGNLKSSAIHNAGRQKAFIFYKNGNIAKKYEFIDMDFIKVGEWVEYYESGNMKSQAFYKETNQREEANIKTGTWSWWDEEGNLVKQEQYKNNELIETKSFLPKIKEE